MKENIKNVILYFSIFYMIVIIVLSIISYGSMVTVIELSTSDEYLKELNTYKEKVNNLKDSTCKDYLNKLVNRVEKDVVKENLNLKEYYEELSKEDNFLMYYSEGKDKCNILNDEVLHEKDMPLMYLTSAIQNSEIVKEHMYQYELSLKDYKTREINIMSLVSVENNIKVRNEIKIIKELFSIISEKEG